MLAIKEQYKKIINEYNATNFMELEFVYLSTTLAKEYLESKDSREAGWYYRFHAPGYLDATDFYGPYDTELLAVENAIQEINEGLY